MPTSTSSTGRHSAQYSRKIAAPRLPHSCECHAVAKAKPRPAERVADLPQKASAHTPHLQQQLVPRQELTDNAKKNIRKYNVHDFALAMPLVLTVGESEVSRRFIGTLRSRWQQAKAADSIDQQARFAVPHIEFSSIS